MSDFHWDWRGSYRWRTNLRSKMPWCLNWLFGKGEDCEAAGGSHQWYNIDNENSGCYHCQLVREGQLWRKPHSVDSN